MAFAKSVRTDPFHNHRFHVVDTDGTIGGGFNTVSLPELTIDTVEYREGMWNMPRKFPTKAHLSIPVSLHRGVTLQSTSLYKWILSCAEGRSYRKDIRILHFHRSDVDGMTTYAGAPAAREIRCYNCVPMRYRPGTDLDATSPEVSIEELDLEAEFFRLFVRGEEVRA